MWKEKVIKFKQFDKLCEESLRVSQKIKAILRLYKIFLLMLNAIKQWLVIIEKLHVF